MKNFIQNSVNNSLILSYFKGPDRSRRFWDISILTGILNLLFNLPSRLLKLIYSKWEPAFQSSILIKAIRYLTDRMHIVIGLFLIVNMIVPDQIWHNEYGVYLTLMLFAVFILKTMIDRNSTLDMVSFDYSAILFFISIMMAGITSLFPEDSFNYLVYYFISFLAMIVIISSLQSKEQLAALLRLISLGTFLTAVYGIYQWKVIGIEVDPSLTDLTISRDLGGRVFSTMGNANIYGELLVLTIPFFVALILNERPLYRKFFWALLLAPVILVLFKTGSRASWVAFAASALVFLFFWNIKLIPVFMFLGVIAVPFLPAPIYNRIQTIFNSNDTSVEYRFKILNSALSMLRDYWVTGVGLGTRAASTIFHRYKTFGLTNVAHSHILLLQIWLEAGISALTAFLLMLFRMTRNTFAAVSGKKDKALSNMLAAALSALAGLVVMGFADHVWFYNRILFMFWMVAAIVFTALKLIRNTGIDASTNSSAVSDGAAGK